MQPTTAVNDGHIHLKPSDVSKALACCVNAKMPVIVWGPPGIGKSSVTHQLAAGLNRDLIDVRAPQFDAVDLRGLPCVSNGITKWCTPDFWPRPGCPDTIIFLDELNRAPAMVQNALLQLILDRRLGDYVLPDNVEIVSACNNVSDGGGVQKMTSALSNRFTHLNMVVDVDDWCKWAFSAGLEPATIAFVRFRNNLLFEFSRTEKAFPTPRSWSFVSKITAQRPGNGIELALYAGAVGKGPALEYVAFLDLFRKLPNIDAILMNPKTAPLATEPATMFAVASALARKASVTNLGRVFQYLERMPKEYEVFGVQDGIRRDATLTATPEFTRWSVDNADVNF